MGVGQDSPSQGLTYTQIESAPLGGAGSTPSTAVGDLPSRKLTFRGSENFSCAGGESAQVQNVKACSKPTTVPAKHIRAATSNELPLTARFSIESKESWSVRTVIKVFEYTSFSELLIVRALIFGLFIYGVYQAAKHLFEM